MSPMVFKRLGRFVSKENDEIDFYIFSKTFKIN